MRLVTLVVGVYKGVYSMKSAKKKNLAAWKGTKFILTVQVKVLKSITLFWYISLMEPNKEANNWDLAY